MDLPLRGLSSCSRAVLYTPFAAVSVAAVPLAPAPPPPSRSPAPRLPPLSCAQTSAVGGDAGPAGWDRWVGGGSLGAGGKGVII